MNLLSEIELYATWEKNTDFQENLVIDRSRVNESLYLNVSTTLSFE